MKLFKLFLILMICLLLGAGSGYFVNRCSGPLILSDTIRNTIPGDSIPYPVVLKVKDPVPVYRDTGSIQWRDRPVDTAAILAEYFTINHYDDILMDDTSALIRLKTHVAENKLHYDSLFFQNRRPTFIQTIINQPEPVRKWAFYAGLGLNDCPKTGIIVSTLLTSPGRIAFEGRYDLNNKVRELMLYYKLQFRKPKKPGN